MAAPKKRDPALDAFDAAMAAEAPAPVAASAPAPAGARVSTPTLDRLGMTGADVKSRVAAGQSPDQPLYVDPTIGERVKDAASNLVVGTGGDLVAGTVVGIPEAVGNVATAIPRSIGAAGKEFLRSRDPIAAFDAAMNVKPYRGGTDLVGEAGADAIKTFDEAMGVRKNAIVDTSGATARLAPVVAATLMDGAGLIKSSRARATAKAAAAAEEAAVPAAARAAEAAPEPVPTPEAAPTMAPEPVRDPAPNNLGWQDIQRVIAERVSPKAGDEVRRMLIGAPEHSLDHELIGRVRSEMGSDWIEAFREALQAKRRTVNVETFVIDKVAKREADLERGFGPGESAGKKVARRDYIAEEAARAESKVATRNMSGIEREIESLTDEQIRLFEESDKHAANGNKAKASELEDQAIALHEKIMDLNRQRQAAEDAAAAPKAPTPHEIVSKSVDEMTPEEMKVALRTSEMTGLPNKRAWRESPKPKFVASVDLNNFKSINDELGHHNGDKIIGAYGDIFRDVQERHPDVKVYHISGDEFRVGGEDAAKIQAALDDAHEVAKTTPLYYIDQEGNTVQVPDHLKRGHGYGIGTDIPSAEAALKQHKAELLARGERVERRAGNDRPVPETAVREGNGEAGGNVQVPPAQEGLGSGRSAPPPEGPPRDPGAASTAPEDPKYARPSSINLDRLNISEEAKASIRKTAEELRPELEKAKGGPVTHEEVLRAAVESEILTKASSREATVQSEARLLRTRQHLAGLSEESSVGVSPDYIRTFQVVSAEATRKGRELNALKIGADPELASIRAQMVKKLLDLGHKTEEIVAAAKGVDFNNFEQAATFYRKFVKPTWWEILKEYRYINLLSSPKTHEINMGSNAVQVGVLHPAMRLGSGAVDMIGSTLRGTERTRYMSEVPAYYKGALNHIGDATADALRALRGDVPIEHMDLRHIPTGNKFLKPLGIVSRALEANDVFFRGLAQAGEKEALMTRAFIKGEAPNAAHIAVQSADAAAEAVFRKKLDPSNASGHGHLLSTIDSATGDLQHLASKWKAVNWIVPFIPTPMNILKQGIEYSPAGFATLAGSTRKEEQLAKAFIGSTVFAGAAWLAMQDRTTWAAPRSFKERQAFYDAGMQPYAVKVGDKWISYAKIGPLAYPLVMAAAAKYYAKDDPKATSESSLEKGVKITQGIAEFFSDQSVVQGLGDLVAIARGDEGASAKFITSIPAQLVPLASLQRWVTQIIDPVYRKPGKGLSPESIIQNLKRGIPGLSETVPAMKDAQGRPSVRQMPVINAVSPLNVSEQSDQGMRRFKALEDIQRRRAEAAARKAAFLARQAANQ